MSDDGTAAHPWTDDRVRGHRLLNSLLWAYFLLLPLEGVLRKWVLPQWSDPLFLIRDPVAILVYLSAWRAGLFPWRPAIVTLYILAVLALFCSFAADIPIAVIAFGLRTDFLHVPMVFVIASAFDRQDVVRIGRWCMILCIPITILMTLQFNAPVDDALNVGVGGRIGGQITGALGHIRPPGPFSFISDAAVFFALTGAFVAYGWFRSREFPRWLQITATIAVAVAIPISISRLLLLGLLVVAVFALLLAIVDFRKGTVLIGMAVAGVALLAFVAQLGYIDPMFARWDEATTAGGGDFKSNVLQRILVEFTRPFAIAVDAPWLGHGIGLGTVGGARLATGNRVFVLAESELARIVLELGPVVGFAFIAWRVWLSLKLVFDSWRAYRRTGVELPWLLAGASFLPVLYGQWGPATQLGFAVFGAGLTLAALNVPSNEQTVEADDDAAGDL